jgi:hypothetical protein
MGQGRGTFPGTVEFPVRLLCPLAASLVLAACTPKFTTDDGTGSVGGGDDGAGADTATGDTGAPADTGEDPDIWDGASLRILAPSSGEFIELGEEVEYVAVVYDAEGNATDWSDIVWTASEDSAWGKTAASFEDDTLDVGLHVLRAEATLPNGARVNDSVGGVLVQHPDAGTYVGNMVVDVTGEYQGTPITASCIGAAIVVVDPEGEVATGESECIIALLGFNQNAVMNFDYELDRGDLSGESALDLWFIQYGFDTEGSVDDGTLTSAWADNVFGLLDISGTLDLTRVTRDTEGG